MTKLKITVTKEILEKSKYCGKVKGKFSVTKNCAVALAVRDIFPDAVVGSLIVFFGGINDYRHSVFTPNNVYRFINEFDRATPQQRCDMNPISFEIEIPDSVIEKINIDELRPLLENHPTLQLV